MLAAGILDCVNQHYFSESPEGEFRPREIETLLAGSPRSVLTAGGVFSPDGLDRGTAVLLRELPDPSQLEDAGPEGPILDIGCGWGPIALAAALEHPGREVWAVDVNERSRELTARNAARLELGNVRVAAPEEVPPGLAFAEIRSNPPIRVGKEVLHGILREWLPRLLPGGAAYLVVAKHLGADSLQRWIAAEFPELEVSRAARDKGFHVIEARAPRA
ncbi:methyltransferase [Leucobacter ruminantium]|uniref:Methyltransferase n=1 Tax=Leucobacter ruminantium TaxID=1289170 RepID=A0A939LS90_9MICO|nr:methyltransferase [Leucobacter ruminantium]MBO1803849.1 methyltransferase [Leucobacter ruminantium]